MDDKVREDDVSMDEIEAEDAVSLANKEVLSLLDVNANVDLGLDLAAPVDLAAAANLNVAAPIEAAALANVLSSGAEAVGVAQQHGTIDQTDSGNAIADAPQHAQVDQSAAGATSGHHTTGGTTPTSGGTAPTTGDTGSASGTTGTRALRAVSVARSTAPESRRNRSLRWSRGRCRHRGRRSPVVAERRKPAGRQHQRRGASEPGCPDRRRRGGERQRCGPD